MWFSGFFFSHFVCHSWSVPMMKITGLIFLSGITCTIGGWLNTFLPHFTYIHTYIHAYIHSWSRKFTFTKLTVPLNRLENYVVALEASDRLIDIIWVNWRGTCGCISRPTFKLGASLLDIMVKSKEIIQDLRKKW